MPSVTHLTLQELKLDETCIQWSTWGSEKLPRLTELIIYRVEIKIPPTKTVAELANEVMAFIANIRTLRTLKLHESTTSTLWSLSKKPAQIEQCPWEQLHLFFDNVPSVASSLFWESLLEVESLRSVDLYINNNVLSAPAEVLFKHFNRRTKTAIDQLSIHSLNTIKNLSTDHVKKLLDVCKGLRWIFDGTHVSTQEGTDSLIDTCSLIQQAFHPWSKASKPPKTLTLCLMYIQSLESTVFIAPLIRYFKNIESTMPSLQGKTVTIEFRPINGP